MPNQFKVGDTVRLKSDVSPPSGMAHGERYVVDKADGVAIEFADTRGGRRVRLASAYVLVKPAEATADRALAWIKSRYSDGNPDDRTVLAALLSDVYGITPVAKTTFTFGPSPF